MKRWIPWLLTAVVVVLIGAGVARALSARQAQQQSMAQAAGRERPPLLVQADELIPVRARTLGLSVPVSGAVRAVESAVVKARVAGELLDLTVREGDAVAAGQVIARIDPTEYRARLRQSEQQADAARAQVDIQQRQYDNNRALVAQGFISSTALAASQSSLEAARASYEAAAAAADVARKALQDAVLRSPIAGQVSQRFAQPGERMAIDGRVVEVVDLSRLELEGLVAPADSTQVRVGQEAQLTIDGDTARTFGARVVRIGPSAQAGSRNVPVYLRIDAGSEARAVLRPGLFLTGTVAVGSAESLALPIDAVRTDQPRPYVQAVQDGKVVHLPVRTGARSAERTDGRATTWVAVEGLRPDVAVLAGRVGLLREGTRVDVASAAAPAPAPAPAASATAR